MSARKAGIICGLIVFVPMLCLTLSIAGLHKRIVTLEHDRDTLAYSVQCQDRWIRGTQTNLQAVVNLIGMGTK